MSRKKGRDLSRKQPPPKKSAPAPVEQPRSGGLFVVKALVGPTVIGTGWGIMLVAYKTGAVIACIGFVLWTLEFIYEPFLVKAPYRIHIALVMVPIAAFVCFALTYSSCIHHLMRNLMPFQIATIPREPRLGKLLGMLTSPTLGSQFLTQPTRTIRNWILLYNPTTGITQPTLQRKESIAS